jgi:hypothetical protein
MQRPINFSSSNRFGERGIAGISLGGIECGTLPQSRQFASAKQNRAYRRAFTACAREGQRGSVRGHDIPPMSLRAFSFQASTGSFLALVPTLPGNRRIATRQKSAPSIMWQFQ